MVSLVAKSKDPDPTYRAEGSQGMVVMNTPVTILPPFPDVALCTSGAAGEPHFAVVTIKTDLRNF